MNVSRSSLVSPKAFDPQCGGSVSQNLLANPEVEDAGNWDSDCFGLCSSPLPSGPFPSTTAEWSDPALKHDGMLSIESADDFSNQIGDHLKLIVWYRAMIPNTYAYLDDSNTSLEENAERVLHQLITVGEYAVDNRLEPRIRAEIVLGELQHVEALIKNLARCLQERKYVSRWNAAAASGGNRPTSPSKPMGPNETAAAGAIHKRLTEFLHDKLQVGRAGIHAMVDRGHDPTDLSV
ncbi:MAG: hypothetical protein LQ338_005475 [Usnochroma carphineum]|nr:MAG: hypothetical protein LQ338_005475 [Usnochroma carphineum]